MVRGNFLFQKNISQIGNYMLLKDTITSFENISWTVIYITKPLKTL